VHLLDSPEGLSERAQAFLASAVREEMYPVDREADDRAARRVAELFGIAPAEFLGWLDGLRDRFDGLRYHSHAFGEDVVFGPAPDVDDEDEQPAPAAFIESDALHAECAGWRVVVSGRQDTYDELAARAATLTPLPEGSGPTESWWEGDGFRVHLNRTWALLYDLDRMTTWKVWARDDAAADRARAFCAGLTT
jgi:hypothetical protein